MDGFYKETVYLREITGLPKRIVLLAKHLGSQEIISTREGKTPQLTVEETGPQSLNNLSTATKMGSVFRETQVHGTHTKLHCNPDSRPMSSLSTWKTVGRSSHIRFLL